MGWPEVKQAADEHRYELVLSGATVSERIDKSGLDKDIFELTFLNFLQISNTTLLSLPVELGQLVKLKTLDLHKNSLKELPASIGLLKELKHLDLSDNKLQKLPTTLTELNLLQSLNLNCNQLTELPSFVLLTSLKRVDISHNQLKELPDGIYELEHLSEIIASYNQISNISGNISKLPALKVLSLNANKIELLPSELTDCLKLKDLHLQDNSIQDRRLFKVIKQCSTKAVLDYIATRSEKVKAGKKGGKKGRSRKVSEGADNEVSADQAEAQFFGPVVRIMHSEEFKVVSQSSVKVVRPYIVCAVVRNLDLIDADAYKKFINIQTKLHESICDHRTSATIATHDIAPLAFPLEYEACPPGDIQLVPLGRQEEITAEQLITDLRAEAMRQKQKTKRNPYKTGLFKYLTLIEGAESYAVLRDSSRAVVSLPPVTNCDKSKITGKKIDVLLEVTSPVSLETCKTVMDSLIKMMLEVGLFSEANTLVDDVECATSLSNQELVIEQVRVLGSDGQLRVVYPSRVDLQFESVKVIRPEKV